MGSRCVTNPNPSPNPNPNRNHNRNRNPNPNPNPNDGLEVCDCVAFLRRRVEPGSADLLLAAELGLGLGLGLTLTLTLALTLALTLTQTLTLTCSGMRRSITARPPHTHGPRASHSIETAMPICSGADQSMFTLPHTVISLPGW